MSVKGIHRVKQRFGVSACSRSLPLACQLASDLQKQGWFTYIILNDYGVLTLQVSSTPLMEDETYE